MKKLIALFVVSFTGCLLVVFAEDDWGARQNKINQQMYDKRRQADQKLADFVGGVYGSGGVVVGKGTAVTPNGVVTATKDGFITPNGYYATSRGQTWGADKSVTQSGNLFTSSDGVIYREGQVYYNSKGEADFVVLEPVRSGGVSSTMRKP